MYLDKEPMLEVNLPTETIVWNELANLPHLKNGVIIPLKEGTQFNIPKNN